MTGSLHIFHHGKEGFWKVLVYPCCQTWPGAWIVETRADKKEIVGKQLELSSATEYG
jgi:hypothetical protein